VSPTRPTGSAKYFNTGLLNPLQENSLELYERFYGDHEALNEYYQGRRLEFYRAVSAQVHASGVCLDNKDVIDVGSGTGHLLSELRQWSKPRRLTGCDFSEEAIKFSRQRFPGCSFFRHDIYVPLPEQFDVVLCTEVLEHLERPYVALANLLGAVRPGGALVLTVPDGRRDTTLEHINFWSPESWKAFIERECPRCRLETATLMKGDVNFGLLRLPQPAAV
jgi:2-polyprenyl-3-methyl-5-hydroxy-6-metoxy-1,4-benzoquinol methylase